MSEQAEGRIIEDPDTEISDDQEQQQRVQIENVVCGSDTSNQQPNIIHQEVIHNTLLNNTNPSGSNVGGGGSNSHGELHHQQQQQPPIPVSLQPIPVSVSVPVLPDQSLGPDTELRIKVDVEDTIDNTATVEETLQHLHSHHHHPHHHHHHGQHNVNVTTASIITIPVPYTVIGESDPSGAPTGTISVSLADPSTLSHHQHQQHHLQEQIHQQHQEQIHQQQQEQIHHQQHQEQQHQQQQHQQQQQSSISHLTWEEAVSASVLPVRCKDTNAELYKSRFGSGNKGKCIKSGNDWFTPTEFEALCGRGNSKDWKRSIRFGGRTLQTLIDKGFLVPHASSCICSNCVDDAAATGPIRPFTPYQRKRKSQTGEHTKAKLERLTSKDSTTDESSDVGTPVTPIGLAANLNPLTQALMKINQTSPPTTDDAWKNLEDMVEKIISAAMMMKTMLQEMKERTTQEADSLRSQLQEQAELQNFQTLAQTQQQQQQQSQHQITVGGITRNLLESPQILRIFDSSRIQTYSIEVLDPESFKQYQAAQPTTAKIICQDRTLRTNECGAAEIKTEGVPTAQQMT